jgi:hypothetical protein
MPNGNFQLKYISQRPIFRPHLHEKRVPFKHETRPRAFVIRGHEEPTLGFFSPRGRRGVGDKSYKGGRKFVWVPVIPAELKASATVVSKCGRNLNGTDADHGLKPGGQKIAAGVIGVPQQQKASVLVQNEVTLELSLENREDSISHAENTVMHNGAKPSCTKNIAKKGTSQNAFVTPNLQTSEKVVVRPCTSDSAQASSYLCARSNRKFNQKRNISAKNKLLVPKTAIHQHWPRNCDVNEVGCSSVQGKSASMEGKHANNPLVASSSTGTGEKSKSAGVHTDLVMQGCGSGTFENISSMANVVQQQQRKPELVQKRPGLDPSLQNSGDKACILPSSTSKEAGSVRTCKNAIMRNRSLRPSTSFCGLGLKSTTQREYSTSRGSQKVRGNDISDQRMVISAKDKIFIPKTTDHQYRPRYSGGNMIKSVAPGTKPGSQWCLMGLTHTQKRRVQRLRALEIRECITEKCDERFNRGKPLRPPKMAWKEKHITVEENRNVDETFADKNSENINDAHTDMDVDYGV